jgi:hypothetical protein
MRMLNKYDVESKANKMVQRKVGPGDRLSYGFHTGALLGDLIGACGREAREARPLLRSVEPLRGVAGRRKLSSPSTRLRNWRAVKGEPGEE